MRLKFYLLIILTLNLKSFAQLQNVNYGNINFELPTNYKLIDKDILNDAANSVIKENSKLGKTLKQIELDYNERITFIYKNHDCNCINNLVLSQTKTGFTFANKEYLNDKTLQKEITSMYDESIASNKDKINNLGVAKYTKINPTVFRTNKSINYFHISNEMKFEKYNKTLIVDIITIPVEGFFYQLEFSSDERNYDVLLPIINQIISNIKINI